ncbi:MAG: metallophosphoesterase, partial [Campylobacter sp.]|nr:metallophosphoesterase [Campylobacter sp.]
SSVELESINIAGLSDLQGANFGMEPNPLKALADINRSKPTILLSHQPKSLSLLSFDELNNISLVLSGHTHGGQIFPFSLLVWAAQGYIYGESDITPRTKLVVSSGAGFWGPPMRILSNNEIVVLNLIPRTPK